MYQAACNYNQSEENQTGKIGAGSFDSSGIKRGHAAKSTKCYTTVERVTETSSTNGSDFFFWLALIKRCERSVNKRNCFSERLQNAQRNLTKTNK